MKKAPVLIDDILIDHDDLSIFLSHEWRRDGSIKGYIQRGIKGGQVYLHREIMKPPSGVFVDHINGNPLDNRRNNLRLASRSENNSNRRKTKNTTSSIYKGVSFNKKIKKWTAYISFNKKHEHLGCFNCETAAALAYDKRAKVLHGEFCNLNFGGIKR